MTSANRNKDYRELLDELVSQGWSVELTTNGHAKAMPPDASQGIVCFSGSSDPHAYMNIVRDLRRRGFVWPPPSKSEKKGIERMVEAAVNGAPEPSEEPAPEKTVDDLFVDLKDAHLYDALAAEHLVLCQVRMEDATRELAAAEREKQLAESELVRRKAVFDKAFEATKGFG